MWGQVMTDTEEYAAARRRAVAKYGFFVHVAVYAAVMLLLVIINLLTSRSQIWFVWPLIGWGLAVVLHGLRVYVLADKNAIVEAMTERELRISRDDKS